MHFRVHFSALILWGVIVTARIDLLQAADAAIGEATLHIYAGETGAYSIPRNLTGKFCEHLGANIYNGMDAQILRNPTFADYPFGTGQMSPDGIVTFHFEREKIENELRRQAARYGWPDADTGELISARNDGLACFWGRTGESNGVVASPDTGPYGGRAQRLELKAGAGIKQWIWLPLHRTRKYEVELLARSPELRAVRLSLTRLNSSEVSANAKLDGVSGDWHSVSGTLEVSEGAPEDEPYCVTLSTSSPGQLIIGHLFLRSADHISGADPDVIRYLREARLPLLRWPGGNFVSAYHWEDGVGPVERRLTRPNYAWGGVEPNTFGTDEFVAFCRAVGCEPMICVNAGNGTPEEAAHWVEYCNGKATTPVGSRRAANGHSEPFNIRHWEVWK